MLVLPFIYFNYEQYFYYYFTKKDESINFENPSRSPLRIEHELKYSDYIP